MTIFREKPRLSFWQIWNMNFGFLGIQFGFALQNANTSRIFQTLGANIDDIAILWIAAPTTGLLVQPIIGYLSDNTWSPKWGRRRPFFAIGALLASIALFVMPHSSTLWMAAGMLWILDASINVSMEPFRAFVGDMLPEKQRTLGFATQTFFIGVGSVIASVLPYVLSQWFMVSNDAGEGQIPDSVVWSFYLGGAAFFGAVMWTVFTTKEYSPEQMQTFNGGEHHEEKSSFGEIFTDFWNMPATMRQLTFVQFFSWLALFAMWIYTTPSVTSTIYDMKLDKETIQTLEKAYLSIENNQRKLPETKDEKEIEKRKKSIEQLEETKKLLGKYNQKLNNGQKEVVVSISFATFFTKKENASLINLDEANRKKLKKVQDEFNKGSDWVGIMFAAYNGFSALFAFMFAPFVRMTSRKTVHSVGLIAGGLGLLSIYFATSPEMLILSMAGVGFAWASILTMPYAILTGALPPQKMGVYMGIFNFFIVIPQILAAALLGLVLKTFFNEEAVFAMVVGGISMMIAAALVFFVEDKDGKNMN
ncbi:MAG: MFS transporter [Bacteroidetes bacterium]|nr:MAG: MFS transporter [Bacteroidota bacterium]